MLDGDEFVKISAPIPDSKEGRPPLVRAPLVSRGLAPVRPDVRDPGRPPKVSSR